MHTLGAPEYGPEYGSEYGPEYGPEYELEYGSEYGPEFEPNGEPMIFELLVRRLYDYQLIQFIIVYEHTISGFNV